MCGIYGSTKIYQDRTIMQKLERIKFRGPDNSDFINYSNKVILGHNRLAIIDLDKRSNQPFEYEHLSITFNGEIYNYKEIREDLISSGFKFSTNSDTEVLVAAYLEYGPLFLNKLNGMFAFVIYDKVKNILFGARDRLGQKPFYYTTAKNSFEFCSQPSPIGIENKLTVDENAISKFLLWNYIPEPNTIYKEVKKLKPGHYFSYNLTNKNLKILQYWDLPKNVSNTNITYNDALEQTRENIKSAVKRRLISDVPLGVFLSGGVDSSLITAFAQNISNTQIKSFNIKFEEDSYDESEYAKKISNHLNTDHTQIICSKNECLDFIKSYGQFFDEPFSDASALPTMLLSKHTKKHVTVALSGDAGDEAFLGYTRYEWMRKVDKLYALPSIFRTVPAALLSLSKNYKHKLLARGLKIKNINELYLNLMTGLKSDILIDDHNVLETENFKYLCTDHSILQRISTFDIKSYLNEDINTKVDRASMAFSLETRSPLQDVNVLSASRNIPNKFKKNKNQDKIILKDILYDYVPKEYFKRPKAGFTMPLAVWFRNELKEYVKDNLTTSFLKSVPNLDYKLVDKLIRNHLEEKTNRYEIIWSLLVLKNWFELN